MYSLIVGSMIRRSVKRLNAGDLKPLLASFADDATLVFPGRSSWAAEYRGKDEIERFLRRFVRVGLQIRPEAILVKGPPWNNTVCMLFSDQVTAADGGVVYANRGVIVARAVWGKIRFQEDYLDTQRVAGLDEYLAANELTGA